jgi:hypothetical protein
VVAVRLPVAVPVVVVPVVDGAAAVVRPVVAELQALRLGQVVPAAHVEAAAEAGRQRLPRL